MGVPGDEVHGDDEGAREALTRTERRRQATHDRLLEATRDLLLERGPGGYTVSELAEAADLGVGTVYNHFDTWRDGPLAEIAQRVLAEWRLGVEEELERQRNAAVAAAHLVHLLSHAPEGSWSDPRLVDMLVRTDQWPREEAAQVARTIVDAGLADGSMAPGVDASLIAWSLLGLALQVTTLSVAGQTPEPSQLNAMVSRILAVTDSDLEPIIDLD